MSKISLLKFEHLSK